MCAARKTGVPKNQAPLQTIEVGSMQVVIVDIVGPFPESEAGNILVAGDCFSKWMEAYPIPNLEFFCWFSTPKQLHSVQGKQFESEVLKEICFKHRKDADNNATGW